MDPNILLTAAPLALEVSGASYPINADHRTGIRVLQAAEDPTIDDEQARALEILVLYYASKGRIPDGVLQNGSEAIEQALLFLNFNEPKRPDRPGLRSPRSALRDFDWDWDAQRIIADFWREYRLDLTDPALTMHWWRFWALFRGLSDTSSTMRAISLRGTSLDDLKGEERKRLKRAQEAIVLPGRTEEEVMALTTFFWS
ncbi:MAG: bacteriophage Gp15 family protein [Coriobacteriia bacterium]|nr:bacteriophage Gp15 family protein [Coriobacteriia bacterium]